MNITEDGEKHSVIWWMFMSLTLESSVFMVKNYSDNWHSIKNTKDLTMKQMFDISAKMVSERDEIYGMKTIDWENSSWKYLSLIGYEQVISLQRTKVYVFSDSVLCLVKIHENPQSNDAWERRLGWFKSSPEYRNLDRIDGEPMEFEWNIFPGFNTLQLSQEVKELLLSLNETPENFTGRIIFMSMFNDISWWSRDNKVECESNTKLDSLFARRFGAGQWSFLGLGTERKWYSISEDSPQGEWDKNGREDVVDIRRKRTPSLPCHESIVPRNAQKQRRWKIIYTLLCRWRYDWNCFSYNYFCKSAQSLRSSLRFVWWIQCLSSKNGATRAGRTIWPIVRAGKIVDNNTYTFDWKTFHKNIYCKSAKNEPIGSHNKMDWWRFVLMQDSWRTVEVGQYFMTKDTDEFLQSTEPVTFREYTLPRDEKSTDPKRLDSREHQNWARLRSDNQLLAR